MLPWLSCVVAIAVVGTGAARLPRQRSDEAKERHSEIVVELLTTKFSSMYWHVLIPCVWNARTYVHSDGDGDNWLVQNKEKFRRKNPLHGQWVRVFSRWLAHFEITWVFFSPAFSWMKSTHLWQSRRALSSIECIHPLYLLAAVCRERACLPEKLRSVREEQYYDDEFNDLSLSVSHYMAYYIAAAAAAAAPHTH